MGELNYVNTFKVNMQYGGPEEGGWWFDVGYPVESICFETASEASNALNLIRAKWNERNKSEGNKAPSSVNCDGYYQTWLGFKYAEAFPRERPHYE